MRATAAALLVLLTAAPADLAGQARSAERQPFTTASISPLEGGSAASGADLATQWAGGVVAGAIGAGLLSLALIATERDTGSDEWSRLESVGAGVTIGYPLGAIGGAYAIGAMRGHGGSLLATAAGGAVGAVAGALLFESTAGVSFLGLPPLGAVIGYAASAR